MARLARYADLEDQVGTVRQQVPDRRYEHTVHVGVNAGFNMAGVSSRCWHLRGDVLNSSQTVLAVSTGHRSSVTCGHGRRPGPCAFEHLLAYQGTLVDHDDGRT